jgi:hypothetical protein
MMQQSQPNEFAEKVRSWVHFDNLMATFTRQVQQARAAKNRWETEIVEYLTKSNMMNAIIQISGARLSLHNEKHANPLTLERLKILLHEYYATKPPGSDDESDAILEYIRKHRGHTMKMNLKKN